MILDLDILLGDEPSITGSFVKSCAGSLNAVSSDANTRCLHSLIGWIKRGTSNFDVITLY